MYLRGKKNISPTGIERPWTEDEVIVSKTNLKGHITYGNKVFFRLAQLSEKEALGKPHNIIRHPHMPRCIFKLLWERLEARQEIFAYVNNMAINGDNYWVFAHVTPSLDDKGDVVGYHSNRRKPAISQISAIKSLYKTLYDEEQRHSSPRDAIAASYKMLEDILKEKDMSYDEFVFSI